jgi:hypothetical protein
MHYYEIYIYLELQCLGKSESRDFYTFRYPVGILGWYSWSFPLRSGMTLCFVTITYSVQVTRTSREMIGHSASEINDGSVIIKSMFESR